MPPVPPFRARECAPGWHAIVGVPWFLYLMVFVLACALPVRGVIAGTQTAAADTGTAEQGEQDSGSRFLIVPYPVTEPAIGDGVLLGVGWMRAGKHTEAGPSVPQGYGFGQLWTNDGSRGTFAFDARSWGETGRWRTTAIAARVDLRLQFYGLGPQSSPPVGFNLHATGGGVSIEKKLGNGANSVTIALYSLNFMASFDRGLPPGLSGERLKQKFAGVKLSWDQDTRDQVFLPSSGHYASASIASELELQWIGYWRLPGKGVLGVRSQFEDAIKDEPFYLKPYISLRGVPALRYPGDQVGEVEVEYRHPIGSRWAAVAFGGWGASRNEVNGIAWQQHVTTGGLGIRFKLLKVFGLSLGLDVARGPDGQFLYVEVGNPWSR